MIWPFKKEEPTPIPEFEGIVFKDQDGVSWMYKPVTHITAAEVAKLLPLFASQGMMTDRFAYIKKHNLQRNFERVE